METGRRDRGSRFGAAVALACILTGLAAGSPYIREPAGFVSLENLVPSALPLGTEVITEGLYGGRIEDRLALKGSSVIFLIEPAVAGALRVRDFDDQSYIRVRGVTAYRSDSHTHYVHVAELLLGEGPRQKVTGALGDQAATPDQLIEVGHWGRRQAARYGDERLEILSRAAYAKALKLRDISLRPDDYEGYFRLAEASYKLLERASLREYYVRQGIDAFLLARGRAEPSSYYDAAREAAARLPGSTLSDYLIQEGFVVESGVAGGRGPVDYFAVAATALRIVGEGQEYYRFLTRALDAERAALRPGDYAAAYGLARRIQEIFPDYPAYRGLVWEAVMIEKSTMDALDADAWFRLGNRILYFLDDRYQSALCFMEAVRLDTGHSQARGKLREMGYVYYQGKWWEAEGFGKADFIRKAQELEDLVARGSVAVGMTRDQVVRAIGLPHSVNYSAGGWGTSSQWVYREGGRVIYVDIIADMVVARGEAGE